MSSKSDVPSSECFAEIFKKEQELIQLRKVAYPHEGNKRPPLELRGKDLPKFKQLTS